MAYMLPQEVPLRNFASILCRAFQPGPMLNRSHGEVTNRRRSTTGRTPEKDGLFCEKIFGPTRDWECYCG